MRNNTVSVANVEMRLSLAVSELDNTQPSSGIHLERIWGGGQISLKDGDVARFHYLPARFLMPKQVGMRSQVHLQRKRPTLDEESNVCYPYGSGKRQNDLFSFPNGDAGATINRFF
jgi:hypothetical protein